MSIVSPAIRDRLDQIAALPKLLPRDQWRSHSVVEVNTESVVRVEGVPYRVIAVHRSAVDAYEWFSATLVSLVDGQTMFLGWDQIEGLAVTFGTPEMTLEAMGVSANWLRKAESEGYGEIRHAGRAYSYKESSPATFYRDCGQKGEKYHYWIFQTAAGYGLSVEKFGAKHSVYLYRKIPPSAVEILYVGY